MEDAKTGGLGIPPQRGILGIAIAIAIAGLPEKDIVVREFVEANIFFRTK